MRGLPQPNNPSKGTIKRRIDELTEVSEEERIAPKGIPERLILGFRESKNVGGISNENFPMVIATTIANFDVSIILIDGRSSNKYNECKTL